MAEKTKNRAFLHRCIVQQMEEMINNNEVLPVWMTKCFVQKDANVRIK